MPQNHLSCIGKLFSICSCVLEPSVVSLCSLDAGDRCHLRNQQADSEGPYFSDGDFWHPGAEGQHQVSDLHIGAEHRVCSLLHGCCSLPDCTEALLFTLPHWLEPYKVCTLSAVSCLSKGARFMLCTQMVVHHQRIVPADIRDKCKCWALVPIWHKCPC